MYRCFPNKILLGKPDITQYYILNKRSISLDVTPETIVPRLPRELFLFRIIFAIVSPGNIVR